VIIITFNRRMRLARVHRQAPRHHHQHLVLVWDILKRKTIHWCRLRRKAVITDRTTNQFHIIIVKIQPTYLQVSDFFLCSILLEIWGQDDRIQFFSNNSSLIIKIILIILVVQIPTAWSTAFNSFQQSDEQQLDKQSTNQAGTLQYGNRRFTGL
jgi:hypothetical protein